jgi:hypothetical protein
MSTTVKTLFMEATSHRKHALKSQRRAAFEKLRHLSQYGNAEEMAEAKLALTHSHFYKIHHGDVAAILSALESEKDN